MDKQPIPPGVAPEQMTQVGNWADHYSRNYEIAFTRVLPSGGTKETLGTKPSPCRFCGGSRPEVKFSKVAHAVPEFAGNGVLLTTYECDACNDRFSAFEDDLAKMTLLYLTTGQVRGKRGVPSVKTPAKLSRVDMEAHGLKFSHYEDDPIVVIDHVAKTMTLTVKSQPYRPLGAYKALVKMALTVMDETDVAHVPEALRWLQEADLDTRRIDDGVKSLCLRTFTPGHAPYKGLVVLLLRRKPDWQDGPGYIFVMAFGNLSFQIVVPSPAMDAGLHGRTVALPPVPLFPYLAPERVEGPTKSWQENFDSPAPTKGSQTIKFGYERMEDVTPPPAPQAGDAPAEQES